jgi:hypothetical protein
MIFRSHYSNRIAKQCTAVLAVTLLAMFGSGLSAQPDKPKDKAKTEPAKSKLGLLINDPKASKGFTLLATTNSKDTYLIDLDGRVVNSWKSECGSALSAYLLENGNLLRTGSVKTPPFFGGGAGGWIQEFTWDGQLVWDYTFFNENQFPNHDICKLPNGNVLMILWEKKSNKEAIAAGRRPETVGDGYLLSCSIFEVQPTGKTTGKIVWKWQAWDHLIQDFNEKMANHGDVGGHPELIDLNFGDGTIAAMVAKPEELEKLRAIGYVGAAGRKAQRAQADWLHVNAVAYNAELDQIMLSVYEYSELWIIDHSTKSEEAAGHKGGRYGKGGDLLYRWGNPRAYRAGTIKDQKLFGQHNPHWIPNGRPGEGHVLIFNNGSRRTGGAHSTVDEIVLPVDAKGRYEYTSGKSYGPEKAIWTYVAPKRTDFYAPFISGAQRLPNGNTLICSGTNGTLFEVTPAAQTVWKYVNPVKGGSPFGGGFPPPKDGAKGPPFGPPKDGAKGPPFGGAPRLGTILPSFLQGFMNLSAEQKKLLEAAEKEMAEKLEKLLTDEQKKEFKETPLGFGDFPPAGQLMATSVQSRLKLTPEQKKQLADVQKTADSKLDAIFNDGQKKQFKEMQDRMKAFTGGPPGGGGPRPGGGFPGFGGPGGGAGLFRALRYTADYPGLVGKKLKPGKTIEELQNKEPPKEPKGN